MTSQKLIDEAIAEVLPSTDPLDDPNFDVKHVSVAACTFACDDAARKLLEESMCVGYCVEVTVCVCVCMCVCSRASAGSVSICVTLPWVQDISVGC